MVPPTNLVCRATGAPALRNRLRHLLKHSKEAMSPNGPKQTLRGLDPDVCFGPEADVLDEAEVCLLPTKAVMLN